MKLPDKEPEISVGIISAPRIRFELSGMFDMSADGQGDLTYTPRTPGCRFTLPDVTIGKGFHWQRNEPQQFAGELKIISHGGIQTAVNIIGLEEYLKSVISSEMSAQASAPLLEAHAIVSRSWLLAMLARRGGNDINRIELAGDVPETIVWHDRAEHRLFDVCADDHCQRYQGVTRQTTPAVAAAVAATRGMVITHAGEICDARFSKCCGGVTEEFQTCWEDAPKPYLASFPDRAEGDDRDFCDTTDARLISQVLNSYDREHPGFYRWEAVLDADTLPALLLRKTGLDFGRIKALRPLSRGKSGRISRLLIEGERHSHIIGKELEIRLALSESCLRSSAFDVEPLPDGGFRLHGRGWGHGVGMCQIGAAVMGDRGYTARQIVAHYFPHTEITTLYL